MKKIYILITFISVLFNVFIVSAHSTELDVIYDDCVTVPYVNSSNIGDGVDEKWYSFATFDSSAIHHCHIPHSDNITTIKYIIKNTPDPAKGSTNSNVDLWATLGFSDEETMNIKLALANSLKKWNNVYYYVYTSTNRIIKKRLVNVVEGDESDYNLVIYPISGETYYAATGKDDTSYSVGSGDGEHHHCNTWKMYFNLSYIKKDSELTNEEKEIILERTMAHELGHVLGLEDVDLHCKKEGQGYHHEEILMGYSLNGISTLQTEITYKDIAGVAITRGYHKDDDHMWLYDASRSSVNNFKLICSICNGVKYVEDLSGYSYQSYYSCHSNHDLSSGNMMAVASYGTKDYYKCKYCRWVAPFTSNIEQNYSYSEYSEYAHLVTNQVQGLQYSFHQDHDLSEQDCEYCGSNHIHSYEYRYVDKISHKLTCVCGHTIGNNEPHAISSSDVGKTIANCIKCGATLKLGSDIGIVPGIQSVKKLVTLNGSYIMENGLLVIVDEDIEAYLNDTLIWIDNNNESVN